MNQVQIPSIRMIFQPTILFALALMWLIALATYNPADPVWFFRTGAGQPANNLAGRAGGRAAGRRQRLGCAAAAGRNSARYSATARSAC